MMKPTSILLKRELLMNNEYKNNFDGTPMLVLNYDGSMFAEISVKSGNIGIFSSYDGIDYDCNSIPIEDWEQVKEFVDNQIKSLNKGIQ